MAKLLFNLNDEYVAKLAMIGDGIYGVAERALREAGGVLADSIRSNLSAVPTDKFHRLRPGEKFRGVSNLQKRSLLDSLGVSPVKLGRDGMITVKVGFDGYAPAKTASKKYPRGLPNALLARALESGSSVRVKAPFVGPGERAAAPRAKKIIENAIDDFLKGVMR